MRETSLVPFLMDIELQNRIALVGAANIDAELRGNSESAATVFAGAHLILTSAAQVSKALWPDTSRAWAEDRIAWSRQRGRHLRAIVQPDSLLQKRAVRNAVEHFDERLDSTLFADEGRMLLDSLVSSKAFFAIPGQLFLRHLDPASMTYSVLDDEISLHEVLAALAGAAERANAWRHQHLTRYPGGVLD